MLRMARTRPRRSNGRSTSCGRAGADKVEYFQREGPRAQAVRRNRRRIFAARGCLMTTAADLDNARTIVSDQEQVKKLNTRYSDDVSVSEREDP